MLHQTTAKSKQQTRASQPTHNDMLFDSMFSCRNTLFTSTVPGASPWGQYPLPLAQTCTFTAELRTASGN